MEYISTSQLMYCLENLAVEPVQSWDMSVLDAPHAQGTTRVDIETHFVPSSACLLCGKGMELGDIHHHVLHHCPVLKARHYLVQGKYLYLYPIQTRSSHAQVQLWQIIGATMEALEFRVDLECKANTLSMMQYWYESQVKPKTFECKHANHVNE